MDETKIKDSFQRAKQDIQYLKDLVLELQQEVQDIKRSLAKQAIQQLNQQTNKQAQNPAQTPTQIPTKTPANPSKTSANQQIKPTEKPADFQIPAHNLPLKALKTQNPRFSTGNEGVPTDRQTNQQTDRQTANPSQKFALASKSHIFNQKINHLEKVAEVINSLDDIKKDLRVKFKRLTKQEFLIFSTIYQLEEQGFIVDYPLLAQKLKLTESSIRDYSQKLIKKGIPLAKNKENNKKIYLSILPELKKIASLNTILALREI